ncbi:MAG: hypothetical protein V4726_22290 [Verrucomicrobiota bacterium]
MMPTVWKKAALRERRERSLVSDKTEVTADVPGHQSAALFKENRITGESLFSSCGGGPQKRKTLTLPYSVRMKMLAI